MNRHIQRRVGRRTVLVALSQIGVGVALSACAPNSTGGATPTTNPGNAPAPGGTPAPAATLSAAQAQASPVAGAAAAAASPAVSPVAAPDANVQPSPVSGAAPLPLGAPTPGGPPPTVVGAPGAAPVAQPNAPGGFPVEGAASPVASPAASPAPAVAAAVGTPTPQPAASVMITADLQFNPAQVTVAVGQSVQWRNASRSPQTVTDNPALVSDPSHVALPAGAQPFDSGVINSGQTFTHTFDVAGDYQYVSLPFESRNMTGRVTVQG